MLYMFKCLIAGCLVMPLLAAQEASNIADLHWIAGGWKSAPGSALLEEHWIAPSGGLMLGLGRTIAGNRAVAFEFLRIEQRQDGVYYVAQPGGRPPTDFKLTKSSAGLAVFENPAHDHPKIIEYKLEDACTLVATVEGDEGGRHRKQQFRFRNTAASCAN